MNPATPSATPTTPDTPVDDDRLRRDGRRVEELLEELRELAPAPVYQRIEELVQRMLGLHGAALERLLTIVAEATDSAGQREQLVSRLGADELVSGILMLHGLHPSSVEERIRAALEQIRNRSGRRVSLIGIDTRTGVAHLRLGDRSHDAIPIAIERSILDAAPELTGVTIDNGRDAELIQIDLERSRTER